MVRFLAAGAALFLTFTAGPARAAAGPATPPRKAVDVRPLAPGETAVTVHAPYSAGDCAFCHASNDRKNPGPVTKKGNALCFDCHQEFEEILARPHKHPPAVEACTNCHNPHDSKQKKLLRAEMVSQCLDCHPKLAAVTVNATVKHGAVTAGQKCMNCHNPHASNVEKLLVALPYDLCVNCHGVDGLKDWNGTALTNMKKLIADNPVRHAPVEAKDCSACHQPHGGDAFRLLVADYPAKFYSPFDPKNYELCFTCHDEKIVADPDTTTLTGFRDGTRNLHYLHVHKSERGRTCRACHEVHAGKQAHQLREGVPYGPKGWMLKLNYTKLPNGGSCARTCHDTKTYVNRQAAASK